MAKKLAYNSLSNTALYLVNIAIAFIMSPIIIRTLGNRDYGLWELVMSVIGYMGLLDLGIGPSLMRFVSVADGKQDKEDLKQTVSTSFVFFIAVGTVAALIFFILGCNPGLIVGADGNDAAKISVVFILLGINSLMLFPLQVFIATLMGVQQHYFINNVRIFVVTIRACLTYYFLQRYSVSGLIVMAVIEPVFTAIQFVIFSSAVCLDKNIPRISLTSVSAHKARDMIKFGAKSMTMLTASRLQNQSVPIIIGNAIGVAQIVYFVLPNRLIDYAKGVSQAIGYPLTPYFGAAVGKGCHVDLLKSWLSTTLSLQIISLAMPVVIFFYGEPFLGLWVGQEYAGAGRWIINLLLVGLISDALVTNASRMLTAQGKHGKNALIWLMLSLFSIPLSIWGALAWGVTGVVLGSVSAIVIGNVVTLTMACRVMQVTVTTYLSATLLRLIIPLVFLCVAFLWLTKCLTIYRYSDLLLQLIIGGLVYLIAVWYITLQPGTRSALWARIKFSCKWLAAAKEINKE